MTFARFQPIEEEEPICSKCSRQITEDHIDNDASEAFSHVCIDCADEERAEEEEGDL